MKKIILDDLFSIIPETTPVTIRCADLALTGSAESINIWASEEVSKAEITNIEPRNDNLVIWLEFAE